MKFIRELYELQEQTIFDQQVLLAESADEILTKSAAMLAHGKSLMDNEVIKGLSNKEEQGVSTLADVFAGIEAISIKAPRQADEKKPIILSLLDQAEFKTNNKVTVKLAQIAHKETELADDWNEKLGSLWSAEQALKAAPGNAEAKKTYMALAKEVETRLKKLSLNLIKTKAALAKAGGTAAAEPKLA